MKTPSEHLFNLIQSMTSAEKRFLKIHFSSGTSHLTELFDFVNGQQSYDEKLVKANFKDNLIAKNLKVYKVQLTELILRSLVTYHAKRKVRSQIRIGLEEVEILIDKLLVGQALSRLKKVIKLCEKHNETGLHILTTHHLMKITRLLNRGHLEYEQQDSTKALYQHLDDYKEEIFLSTLARKVDQHSFGGRPKGNYLEQVRQEVPSTDKLEIIKATNNMSAYLIAKVEAAVEPVGAKRIQLQEALVDKFHNNELVFEYAHYYNWEALNDLFYSYAAEGNQQKVNSLIQVFNELIKKYPVLCTHIPTPIYIEAKYHYHHGNEGSELLARPNVDTKELDEELALRNIFYLKYFIYKMLFSLTSGKAMDAKKLLSQLQNLTKNTNSRICIFLDLIELIDHYESNNEKTISYLLSGYQRKIKRGKEFTPFTIAAFDFIRQIIKQQADKPQLVTAFKAQMSEFKMDEIYHLWEEFQLCDWLDHLDSPISFYQLSNTKKQIKRTRFDRSLQLDLESEHSTREPFL